MRHQTRRYYAFIVLLLALSLAALVPGTAAALRTCTVDVSGVASNQGVVTIWTERGLPGVNGFSPIDKRSRSIPFHSNAAAAAALVAQTISENGGMIGVVDATSDQDDVVVTLENDASMALWESLEIHGQSYSRPACDGAYVGEPAKVRIDLSAVRIVVPEGSTDFRRIAWTVKNIGGDPLPNGFQVAWQESGLELRGEVDSGVALWGLPRSASRRFVLEARLSPQRPKEIDRGRAQARPNMDPALDDPRLLPLEISEGPSTCIESPQPSATLLFPYFEVDLDDPGGLTTLVSLTNDAERCTLARVMLWTDQAVPTLTFYVYLSPNDVQTLNLRDVFAGNLPDTSGSLDNPECPVTDPPVCERSEIDTEIVQLQLQSVRALHVGLPDPASHLCGGSDRGDDVARGYATVDVVQSCAFPPTVTTWSREEWLLPEGFFQATGTAFDNVLWGDYFFVDPSNDFAQGDTPVHIPADPERFEAGEFTFYGRYTGFDASDGRYPLSSRFRNRYLNGGPFDGGTDLLIWRDTGSPLVAPHACGTPPPWAPLGEAATTAFDEEENSFVLGGLAPVCPVAGDAASFRCSLSTLPAPPFGFVDLDLGYGNGVRAQAWVTPVMSAEGRYSVSFQAQCRDDLCDQVVEAGGGGPVIP